MSLIQIIDLKKYFQTPKGDLHAVDGVNLSIKKGETLGVVGESGCGKSTLGNTMLRLVEPTSGQMLYDGVDVVKLSKREMKEMRRNMQMIFQDPYSSLNPRMTVKDTISEPLVIYNTYKSASERNKRVLEVMDTVGLARRLQNSYPHELDGGRRQRIGVGRALALNPGLIVCDEPVSALDVSIQAQILNLLMDLQDNLGLTYMFITHDLSVVKHISDNIAVMYLGKCVELAPSKELFRNPLHPYTKALLSAIPTIDISGQRGFSYIIRGEVANPINPAPGCRFAPRCDDCKDVCSAGEIPLVDWGGNHFVACTLYAKNDK